MNYIEWSQEYFETANKLNEVIDRLKAKRTGASVAQKKELDAKISQYKIIYGDCISISNTLCERGKRAEL